LGQVDANAFDPRSALRARSWKLGEGVSGLIVVRAIIRGEPVALGRVDAGVFDQRPALRAFRVGPFGDRCDWTDRDVGVEEFPSG
jgi:hypothetical protein